MYGSQNASNYIPSTVYPAYHDIRPKTLHSLVFGEKESRPGYWSFLLQTGPFAQIPDRILHGEPYQNDGYPGTTTFVLRGYAFPACAVRVHQVFPHAVSRQRSHQFPEQEYPWPLRFCHQDSASYKKP